MIFECNDIIMSGQTIYVHNITLRGAIRYNIIQYIY